MFDLFSVGVLEQQTQGPFAAVPLTSEGKNIHLEFFQFSVQADVTVHTFIRIFLLCFSFPYLVFLELPALNL